MPAALGSAPTTRDPPSTTPAGDPGTSNNMVQLVANVYDHGLEAHNGNLTQTTAFASAEDLRVTSFTYDFRNRRLTTDGEIDFFEAYSYDNANRTIRSERFNGTNDPALGGHLIARSETAYDTRSRVYKSTSYGVDPATGTVGNGLNELTWYDPSGQVMKQRSQGGGGFEKLQYDGVRRVTERFVACNAETGTYEQAGSVAGDIVLEQTFSRYDAASNVIAQAKYERNHATDDDPMTTGALVGPLGSPTSLQSRISYLAQYPDGLGRTVTMADYGTNGSVTWTRSDLAPAPSDTCLVSYAGYNQRGEQEITTDPKGTVQCQRFDDAGRIVRTLENYLSGLTGADVN